MKNKFVSLIFASSMISALLSFSMPAYSASVPSGLKKVGDGTIKVVGAPAEVVKYSAEQSKAQGPFNKFGRGLTNIITSPGEIPLQITDMAQDNDDLTALFGGLFKGTVFMVGRMIGGVYDVVTFPIPVPAHYRPLWQPETIFSGFQEVV